MDVQGLWPGTETPLLLFSFCVRQFVTPWTAALQAPSSMGFPRQEYWSGLPFPSPGDPPNPGIKPSSPALAGRFSTAEPPGKPSEAPWLPLQRALVFH